MLPALRNTVIPWSDLEGPINVWPIEGNSNPISIQFNFNYWSWNWPHCRSMRGSNGVRGGYMHHIWFPQPPPPTHPPSTPLPWSVPEGPVNVWPIEGNSNPISITLVKIGPFVGIGGGSKGVVGVRGGSRGWNPKCWNYLDQTYSRIVSNRQSKRQY